MERRHDPGARPLAAALFLAFAASIVLVVVQTFPFSMILPRGWPETGAPPTALLAYVALAALHGVIWAVMLGLMPLASLPPGAAGAAAVAARLAGLVVAGAFALGALADLAPGLAETLPDAAFPFLMIVPHLTLAAAFALRLSGSGRRAAGLAAAGAAGALATALPLETAGILPLIGVILALAMAALRGQGGHALPRLWAAALAAAWLLPIAAEAVPRLTEALSVDSPRERLATLRTALQGLSVPMQLYHPAGAVMVLAILAGLRQPGPASRGTVGLAWLLAAAVALPEAAVRLGVGTFQPRYALDALRVHGIAPLYAAAAFAGWLLSQAAAPLMALAAGQLFLRAPRRGA